MPIQAADRGKPGKGDFWSAAFWRPRGAKKAAKALAPFEKEINLL
jgi:hypothetical protein